MSQRKVFVRDATGLVRDLGFLDQFFISAGIIIAMNGYVGTQLFAPFYFPGAILILVGLLGCIPALSLVV